MKAVLAVGTILVMLCPFVSAREIHIPLEAQLSGNVLIAERFTEYRDREWVPIEFPAWPGEEGMQPSSWFSERIEAHPGDVLVLAPGTYVAQLWVFTPHITIMTDPEAEEMAVIQGTVEIDADSVTLQRIGVTNSPVSGTSGHGIEVNGDLLDYVTILDCRAFGNRWTGIHMIGISGTIIEMRVENCELVDNGMDGMDAKWIKRLVVTGCTITGNGHDSSGGVGIRIGYGVDAIELENNTMGNNRAGDIHQRE